jgi:hypothetical protein
MDGIAMAQTLGDTVGASDNVRLLHHGHHPPPSGGTGPGPQRLIEFTLLVSSLDFCEAVHHIKRV